AEGRTARGTARKGPLRLHGPGLLPPASRRCPRSVSSPRQSPRLEVIWSRTKGKTMARNRSRGVLLIACGLFVAAAAARAQFEGTADFKIVTGHGKDSVPATGKLFATKSAYRMEWEADLSRFGKDQKGSGSQTPQRIKTVLFGTLAEPDKMYMVDDA